MFLASARALADLVSQDDLDSGKLYPPLAEIRSVSLEIAVAVAEKAHQCGLARVTKVDNLRETIKQQMYDPHY